MHAHTNKTENDEAETEQEKERAVLPDLLFFSAKKPTKRKKNMHQQHFIFRRKNTNAIGSDFQYLSHFVVMK